MGRAAPCGGVPAARFENEAGYAMTICPGTDKFFFRLDEVLPLTYHDGPANSLQPDRRFSTDLGSIPDIVSWLPGYAPNRLAFLFHDSAYNTVSGRGHGLYLQTCGSGPFVFVSMSRRQVDDLMREMLIAEGVRPSAARVIWVAVRMFGPRRW